MKLISAIAVFTFMFSNHGFGQTAKTTTAICNNEDLEASSPGAILTANQVTGWAVESGTYQAPFNSCNQYPIADPPVSASIVATGSSGFVDPIIGSQYPIFSVYGTSNNSGLSVNPQMGLPMFGSNIVRINNSVSDRSMEKAAKIYSVTGTNYKFQFAYIGIFSPTHTCCDAGVFKTFLTNITTSQTLCCPSYSVSAPSSQCSPTLPIQYYVAGSNTPFNGSNGSLIYNKWQVVTLDLSAYIGNVMQIELAAMDCAAGDHFSYVYLDAQCGAGTLGLSQNTDVVINNAKAIPNPFRNETAIEFYLEKAESCTYKIQDITGRVIYEGEQIGKAGKNSFMWNGNDAKGNKCATGVYMVTVGSQEFKTNLKLIKE